MRAWPAGQLALAAAKNEAWEPKERTLLHAVERALTAARQAVEDRQPQHALTRLSELLAAGAGSSSPGALGYGTSPSSGWDTSRESGVRAGCCRAPHITAAVGAVQLRLGDLTGAIAAFETAAAQCTPGCVRI